MVATRTAPTRPDAALENVLAILGASSATAPVRLALQLDGMNTVADILGLRQPELDALTYATRTDEHAEMLYLSRGDRNRLRAIQGYSVYHLSQTGSDMTLDQWATLTPEQFIAYRMSSHYVFFDGNRPPPPPVSSIVLGIEAVNIFKKGIRRDPNVFTVLKEDRRFEQCHLHTKATARAQDMGDVLDKTYIPVRPEDQALFAEKQHYMYSVFVDKLQTDKGKEIVRLHQATSDAQKIYADLVEHYTKSTAAVLDASKILSFLTNHKLGKDSWSGTTTQFIAYWVEQVRLYNSLTDPRPPLQDELKMELLQNAVFHVDELRAVQLQNHTNMAIYPGQGATYYTYLTLLRSAATTYDEANKGLGKRADRRNVYSHDFTHHDFESDPGPYDIPSAFDAFEIDMPLDTIQAYAAASTFGTTAPRLPDNRFRALGPAARKIWASLDADSRRIILGQSTTPGPGFVSNHGPSSGYGQRPNRHPHQRGPRRANVHETWIPEDDDHDPYDIGHGIPLQPDQIPTDQTPDPSMSLMAMATQRLPPGDIRRLLSSSANAPTVAAGTPAASNTLRPAQGVPITPAIGENVEAGGQIYRRIATCTITYKASNAKSVRAKSGALVDRGANGGMAGQDVRIIESSPYRFVNVEGIDRHQITDIPIVTCGAYVVSKNRGPVIAIFHQYAGIQRGPTIHSSGQLEAFENKVNDRSRKIDAEGQLIVTSDGYEFPLHIRNGLAYLDMRPFTDAERDKHPHVIMTSDVDWDPSVLDNDFPLQGDEEFLDASGYDNGTNFDAFGNYRKGTIIASTRIDTDPILQDTVLPDDVLIAKLADDDPGTYTATFEDDIFLDAYQATEDIESYKDTFKIISPHLAKAEVDPEILRKHFAWLPADIVRRTLENTTQYARVPMGPVMQTHYKSPYPALNVKRRNEDLYTDTVYADTPAIDDGSTSAQFFVGRDTGVCDVYGMKSDKQFVNTLEDQIRERGAPNRLLSDAAVLERSKRVLDILRALCIGQWFSEPHKQHQNRSERRYQTAKRLTNVAMDRSGCPPSCWLLCLQYICLVLNCTAWKAARYAIPLSMLLGTTIDVSPLLRFYWYQPVLYAVEDAAFPSESKEAFGHFVGIAPHTGHAMTYKVLSADTNKVLWRSNVRPADDPNAPNLRLTDLFDGETPTKIYVKSKGDPDDEADYPALDKVHGEIEQDVTPSMTFVDTSELVGRTFLMDKREDGQRHRARIVEAIEEHNLSLKDDKDHKRFRLSVNDDQYEELMSYNDIIAHLERDQEESVLWKFKRIIGHQGPLAATDPDYNGSNYNVQVEWENGEITYEPLSVLAADDPVTCAIYARDHDLLDKPGWKRFKGIAKRQKKMLRMANQAKLRSFRTAPRYKYGFEIPRDYQHAVRLDERNKNTKWQDAAGLEMCQLFEYQTFIDKGHKDQVLPPEGYKRIRVHLVFDVKHDGRHKVRLVADGHLTEVPVDSVYSGVVSLRGLRLMIFLGEHNALEIWATDIGNAYLEVRTKEKLYIIAGPEFGKLEGHILVIYKALYGFQTSGLCWHERFADCLCQEGFEQCKAEPDIGMRPNVQYAY